MQRAMFVQLAVGLLIGGGVGAAMGYFGKCTTGACPLTANPWRGGMIGAMLGGLMMYSVGAPRWNAAADENSHRQIAGVEEFNGQVLGANQPVLVDFYSNSCGPCRMLAPTIEKLAEQYEGRAAVVKVSVDRLPQLARQYGIQGIPAVLFFQNGEEAGRLVGLQPREAYTEVLDRLIGSST